MPAPGAGQRAGTHGGGPRPGRFQAGAPALDKAVDLKIDEIQDFVAFWDGAVTPGKGARNDLSAVQRFSCDDAEIQTGIKHQTVSKWRKAGGE